MRITTRLAAALSLIILLTPAPPLAAQTEEDEYAETPTHLGELLPEEGVAATAYEFYLYEADSNVLWTWKSYEEDGRHVVTMCTDTAGLPIRNTRACTVYTTPEGEFAEYLFNHFNTIDTQRYRAIRDGDQIRIGHGYVRDWDSLEPQDYTPLDNAIPWPWLPLALAYHLRASHEMFEVRATARRCWGYASSVRVMRFEHVGTETVEVDRAEHTAHVLMMHAHQEFNGEQQDNPRNEPHSLWYVLENGVVVKMMHERGSHLRDAVWVSAEQADELLGEPHQDEEPE